ncbi:hypothetical protein A2276_02085 [candidate division WOR-1 bacterium RIFOXYA12_FULL_43_27]|uniref:Thioredoxin domain-containing protein n=1 Tax=candidate division WOR-1 bacterium RIFOXYC2_FULL_46_14 TaxID=1802587 RepID=A0A1F4U6F3_UNCSA|nr:MAG: hypothetical protein A2276_02085 [candidate division WOR-1 bacterium RIFOXYA12_FULL_43_27]OGC19489.1 MAG: hypothetical protein A2292_02245 [candidate division WOR-1 bacterium RIFOXYB2_FULL_46_45]OGC30477.1 MAG: hypothetical protein A2232_02245 [candidate division WOR-1 bacterium RIFOXYA2_FULL_46_56]OGC40545.1 MAG: hypothetical protein A2438_05960 [candidate division WOR-1 bacterium RIFOXYC2_FULL_46_14]
MNKKIIWLIIGVLILGAVAYSMANRKGGDIMTETGKMADDFTLESLSGSSETLSSYKGKVVFLNFWATWCPPCRGEMPSIQKLHEKMQGKDFVILAVAVGERKQAVESFINSNKYTFPILLDPENEVSEVYRVAGIPTTLLIDKSGKVVFRETGGRDWSSGDVIGKIDQLLK